MNLRPFFCWLALAFVFAAPLSASACPLCKDAISTADSADEINNLPAAYNNSIYLMVSVPYLTLGLLGYFVYRGLKKNAAYYAKLSSRSA